MIAYAWMNYVALSTRQEPVRVVQALVLCSSDLTDHNSVNYVLSKEVSAGGYYLIMQSLLKLAAKEILPRYLIIFTLAFETSMLNLIRQRKDHLSL